MLRFFFGLCLLFATVSGLVAAEAGSTNYGGVGLQVVPTVTGELVVLRVIEASPAAQRQLKPGDLLLQVDDFKLKGSDFATVVSEHLWGPEGSPVTLLYLRPGVAGTQTVTLTRTALDPQLTVTPSVQGGTHKEERRP